jgi:3-hydroxyacyl-[acyl-carrier-protein] dehydratase
MRVVASDEACGTYRVGGNEFFLQGHYPGNPIVPGNILTEMLAQLGAALVSYKNSRPDEPHANLRMGKTPMLAGLNNFRFKRPVRPGDTVDLHITFTKDAGLVVSGEAEAHVEGQLAVSGDITVVFI